MSTIKTVTSALTAAVLVTSIGLAFAQTEDQPQQQPTDPMAAATAATPSEQTPADPNAAPVDPNAVAPVDSTAMTAQQQEPATPPADTAAPLPSSTQTDTTTTTTTTTPSPSYDATTPAPRADRH